MLSQKNLSVSAIDMIGCMMTKQPEYRYSAAQALQHPWIKSEEAILPQQNLFKLQNALDNLKSFSIEHKMQEAVMTYLVQHMQNSEEMEDQKQIFLQLDVNRDGQLTREELVEGYRKHYGDLAEIEVDEIMKMADTNGNGAIDYSEWLAASVERKNLITNKTLSIAFKHFDKDGSGKISMQELKEVVGSKKKVVDDKVWLDIIKEVDTDGDNEVSFEEFSSMMAKLVEKNGFNIKKNAAKQPLGQ